MTSDVDLDQLLEALDELDGAPAQKVVGRTTHQQQELDDEQLESLILQVELEAASDGVDTCNNHNSTFGGQRSSNEEERLPPPSPGATGGLSSSWDNFDSPMVRSRPPSAMPTDENASNSGQPGFRGLKSQEDLSVDAQQQHQHQHQQQPQPQKSWIFVWMVFFCRG